MELKLKGVNKKWRKKLVTKLLGSPKEIIRKFITFSTVKNLKTLSIYDSFGI